MGRSQGLKAVTIAALTGLLLLALGLYVDSMENDRYRASVRAVLTEQQAVLRSGLEQVLNAHINLTTALEAWIKTCPVCGPDEFAAFAAGIAKGHADIRSLQLAPEAVVSFVYPLRGNEAAVGLDLRTLEGQSETVERTIREGRLVLAGPVDLYQGGQGLVARKPIFLPDLDGPKGARKFWGFTTVILDFDALLIKAGWRDSSGIGMFALRGRDALGSGGAVFLGRPGVFDRTPIVSDIAFPNGHWRLAAVPTRGWDALRPGSEGLRQIVALLAVMAGFGIWVLIRFYYAERRARDEAAEANRAKSSFMAKMSHELRTPLNAIIGFASIMMEETLGRHCTPRYREYSRDIYNSGSHLLELVNTILDMEKVEAGRFELYPEDLILADVVPESLRLVEARANEAGVALVSEVADGLPMVKADRRVTRQMLLNLLTNGVKFTERGGTVTIRVDHCGEGGVMIAVSDTGIGIAEKDIETALIPFGRVKDGRVSTLEGTGLGLPLTRLFIEMHGGTFDLTSAAGIGTTVTLCFPSERMVEASQRETAPDGVIS